MKFVLPMSIGLFIIGCSLLYLAYYVVETIEEEHFLEVWGSVIGSIGIMFLPLYGLFTWLFKDKN